MVQAMHLAMVQAMGGGREQAPVKPPKCGLSPAQDKEQQGSTETHSPLLHCSQEKQKKWASSYSNSSATSLVTA